MKDRDFYEIKERQQSRSELFNNQVFSGKRDMQYLSEQEKAELGMIPDEAIIAIKKFDFFNSRRQTSQAGDDELEVCVPLFHTKTSGPVLYYDKGEPTLLYALINGTAYTVENGNIYIWYKPWKGFEGSGFYRLKRFIFIDAGELLVKYFLSGNEKL